MKHPTILVATNTKSGHKPTGITSDNFILIPAKKKQIFYMFIQLRLKDLQNTTEHFSI